MLTVKQESFAQAIASGMATTAAYRQAFNNDTGKDTTITPRASRLAHSDNVQARINELREESAAESSWTRERYVCELWRRSQAAHQAGQFAASIKAIELIGKACGLGGGDRADTDNMTGYDVLTRLARLSMDQLENLARQHNQLAQPGTVEGESRLD
jgi:hypothetical protein